MTTIECRDDSYVETLKNLKQRQHEVLTAFWENPNKELTVRQVADYLLKHKGLPREVVNVRPRITELYKLMLISPVGRVVEKPYNRSVTQWKLEPELSLFDEEQD